MIAGAPSERMRWPTPSRAIVLVAAAAMLTLLVLPVVALVSRAGAEGALSVALGSPAIIDALLLSLGTTAVAMAVVVGLGTPLAFVLARRHVRGAALLETAVNLPIVLPPAVAGLALLLVFGRSGLLGSWLVSGGIVIPFSTAAVVLAQVFVAAPFFILAARAGLAGVDADIEDAARVDGASEWQLFRWVTLPQAAPALAAGLVMCWARAMGEFGATIMFAGNVPGRTQTLPLSVYAEFQGGDLEASIAAATILVLAAFGVLVAVRGLRWGRTLDTRIEAR